MVLSEFVCRWPLSKHAIQAVSLSVTLLVCLDGGRGAGVTVCVLVVIACQAELYAAREARLHKLELDAASRVRAAQVQADKDVEAKKRNAAESALLHDAQVRTTFQQAEVHLKEALLAQEVERR